MTLAGLHEYPQSPPSNFELAPENMAVNAVNDSIRTLGGHTRVACNNLGDGWWRYGDGDGAATISYVSSTSFKVGGSDQTAAYTVGRRVRAVGTTTGDIKGTIFSCSYSAPDTTVTVTWDSGSLQSETLAIYIGTTGTSLPRAASGLYGAATTASTSLAGVVEIATAGETTTGTDTDRAIVPANLAAGVNALARTASTSQTGFIEIATSGETIAGSDTARAIVPANLAAGIAALVATASTTTAGVSELATAAETVAGSDSTRALTSAGFAGNKTLNASNGHYKLPSNLQFAWGSIANASGGGGTATFSNAFTTVYAPFVCAPTGVDSFAICTSISTTQIGLDKVTNASGATQAGTIYYLVVGIGS